MTFEEAARFVEENMKTIFAYALRRVSHKEDAEDLAGDIVVAILESAPRVREPDAFFGYVWAIADNVYKTFLRRKKRGAAVDIDTIAEAASDSDVEAETVSAPQVSIRNRRLELKVRLTFSHEPDIIYCV